MHHRRWLTALCSLVFITPYSAHADWDIPIVTTTEAKYYADSDTKRSAVLPSVWILADYDQPQHTAGLEPNYLSMKLLSEADCSAKKLRTVSLIYYSLGMGQGDALGYSTFASEWGRPTPRSPLAAVFGYLCPEK